jgi:glucosamine--fructose-6-phosphate aminotransferase (isomerizing)
MCGIIGYIGKENAVPVLIDGLARLEYRGYDSAGISIIGYNGQMQVFKKVGRLNQLTKDGVVNTLKSYIGIGHTRWATHGAPSDMNAHPHTDCTASLAVVHNGIIENFQALKEELQEKGHRFKSQTDTEVIAHLLEEKLKNHPGDFQKALQDALKHLDGSYALGVVHKDNPGILFAARKGSPLIVGLGKGENFIASDVSALLKNTKKVIYLEDGQMAVISSSGCEVKDLSGRHVKVVPDKVSWRLEEAEKGGFEKFMLKEIHEQPEILKNVWMGRIRKKGEVYFEEGVLTKKQARGIKRLMIVACGTAYYAASCGKYILEHYTSIPVEVELGSEFRYRSIKLSPDTTVLAVSQSGETADTLASIRKARDLGCRILSIVNVVGSTLTRESDAVIYTQAGPEISVASTKAYLTQLAAFYLLTVYLGRARGEMSHEASAKLLSELVKIPEKIEWILHHQESIKNCAKKYAKYKSSFYLGRGFNYPTALEGALKNKEISYSHAEGYAAGEMKHGPIALIDREFPVFCICTRGSVYEKMISNVKEIEARSGKIIAIANPGDNLVKGLANDIIEVPETLEELSPLVNVVPLQLLAYYLAIERGCDIDRPRNLAKSVTVE